MTQNDRFSSLDAAEVGAQVGRMTKEAFFLGRKLFEGLADLVALNPEAAALVCRRTGEAFAELEQRIERERDGERAARRAAGEPTRAY